MWLSDPAYVSALVNAGCMGFLTARSYEPIADFEHALRHCDELTDGKPFGVNITLSQRAEANRDVKRWIEVALAHGVRIFETAGYAPAELIRALHAENAIVIHKASSIRHALSAELAGADAIALVGMEEGGHPGNNELPTMLLGALAVDRINVPVLLGGGIGHGRQLAAVLAQGLDGVLIGSRFLVCEEINAHRDYKEHLLGCDEHATILLLQSMRNTWRVLYNDTARQVEEIERTGTTSYAAFGDLINGKTTRDHCYARGDWQRGMVSLGPSIVFANQIEPLRAIVEKMMDEAHAAISKLLSKES